MIHVVIFKNHNIKNYSILKSKVIIYNFFHLFLINYISRITIKSTYNEFVFCFKSPHRLMQDGLIFTWPKPKFWMSS